VIDPDRTWCYRADEGYSKSVNTPFDGWEMTGRAVYTIVGGRVVYDASRKV